MYDEDCDGDTVCTDKGSDGPSGYHCKCSSALYQLDVENSCVLKTIYIIYICLGLICGLTMLYIFYIIYKWYMEKMKKKRREQGITMERYDASKKETLLTQEEVTA